MYRDRIIFVFTFLLSGFGIFTTDAAKENSPESPPGHAVQETPGQSTSNDQSIADKIIERAKIEVKKKADQGQCFF